MFIDKEKARDILSLLNEIKKKYADDPDAEAKACAELDSKVGDMWRKEVIKGGLGHELPKVVAKSDASKDNESILYSKVKKLMEHHGLPSQGVPVNTSEADCEPSSIKKRLAPKDAPSPKINVSISIG
jgi:hypothetical protein